MSLVSDEAEVVDLTFGDEAYRKVLGVLIAKARTCFRTYFHLFNPQGHSAIILGDLHRYLIQLIQDVRDGKAPANNAVSVPPQHGKSTTLSVEAPSWLLGVDKRSAIAITSFSRDLAIGFSKAIRTRLDHPLYQLIFPGVRPVKGSDRMDLWETTTGGSVVAKPAGSKLTGRRVDWLFMDDVHPGRAEAESPTMRKKVLEWYFADCLTRVHPRGKQFLIGTRWHPADLIGHLTAPDYVDQMKAEGQGERTFRKINIQAISEPGVEDPLGRQPGEALFPEERPLSYLKGMKAAIPNYEWRSQFQGDPQSSSSGQVDVGNLIYMKPDTIPWEDIDEIVRGWDLALSEKQTADYTAGPLVGYNRTTKALYILDMFRQRLAWPKLKPVLIAQAEKDLKGYPKTDGSANIVTPFDRHRVLRQGMEGVSGFKIAVEEVRTSLLGRIKVELKNPPPKSQGGGSKLLRAQPWLNKIEAGLVYVLRAEWTKDFVDELEEFPEGKHDDQVDGISICQEMLEKRGKLLIA